MRNGKGKKRLAELSPVSSPNLSPDEDGIPTKRTVWISNDNGDPCSPLSIERLPHRVGRRISKVAHVRPRCNVISKNQKKKGRDDSESFLPFFIDKTPTRVREAKSYKKRQKNVNNSVVVLDSPSSSVIIPQVFQPVRKDSVDTVDLCSDSEEEHEAPKRKSKPKKKTTGHTSVKLNENASAINSPDIIILDDEEESTNNLCDNNSSVIVESISMSSVSMPSSKNTKNKTCESSSTSSVSMPSSKNKKNKTYESISASSVSMPSSKNIKNKICSTVTGTSSDLDVTLPSNCFPPLGPSIPLTSNASNFMSTYTQHTAKHPLSSFGTTSTSVTDASKLFNYNTPLPRNFHQMQETSASENFSDRVRKVFTERSENSVLSSSVGSNVFNPNGEVEQTGLRPIIIDGCNVAIAHGGDRIFSVRGLCICVEYFLRRGHTRVLALVPLHHRSKVSPRDRDILESLQRDQHLVYTPSRYIDHRLISSYDDRYIVQYAAAVGGVIVSRDNYRDLLAENPAWKDTILNRLLMPTWVGDMLMFPVDPLGKKGPTLDEFLSFPKK